jgi:hypothetical protein
MLFILFICGKSHEINSGQGSKRGGRSEIRKVLSGVNWLDKRWSLEKIDFEIVLGVMLCPQLTIAFNK